MGMAHWKPSALLHRMDISNDIPGGGGVHRQFSDNRHRHQPEINICFMENAKIFPTSI